jgi:hypothetical protein
MGNSIVPVSLVVKSLRDSGYKNTAFAIAELIDNSVQHGSSVVDLICVEKDVFLGARNVSRIDQIAVLDNGHGMDEKTLQMALQFGNGTNLAEGAQISIGKFGMGLPSSSISQGIKVEVWTWQNGVENAIYSYLDVNQIISGALIEVPIPIKKSLDKKWSLISGELNETGTLIVWSELDRCLWKTGKTIIDHSEFIVGRMYRKFINTGKCQINAIVVNENNYRNPEIRKSFLSNDPLYLMSNTSISKSLSELNLNDPMFIKYGGEDGFEKKYEINYNDKKHIVTVRYSIASEETRKAGGNKTHGKHAAENVGLSVIRAGRELDLDKNWAIGYDPRERWWGVEIEFQPSLDEVFGVTNNKQYANNFRELGTLDIMEMLRERGQSIHEFKEELKQDNDPKLYLIEIAIDIKNQIKSMRDIIRAQAIRLERGQVESRYGTNENEAELQATEATEVRMEEGYIGESELKASGKTENEKLAEIINELNEDNVPEANQFALEMIKSNVLYQFIESNFESSAFFSVSPVGGKIIIKLNTSHPAYGQFVEILNEEIDNNTEKDEIIRRLINARNGMKLLLMAWARYEDEQPDGKLKDKVKDTRMDWGKMASEFMQKD